MGRRGFLRTIAAAVGAGFAVPLLPAVAAPVVVAAPITTITCSEAFGVDFQWTDIEHALTLEQDDSRMSTIYRYPTRWDVRNG